MAVRLRDIPDTPTQSPIRLSDIPDEPRTSPGFAFLRSAIDEFTAPLPIRRIPELLLARQALAGDDAARERIVRHEMTRHAAERQHPIATGVGQVAGFTPAFLLAGHPVKMAMKGVPALARLATGGGVARAAAEGVRQAGQFGLAEAFQGRPEAISPSAGLGAVLGPVSTIGRAAIRIPAGAATLGGISAALAPPGQRLASGAYGAGMGALGTAFHAEAPRPVRLSDISPTTGMAPESYFLHPQLAFPEEFTLSAAARAAQEGFASLSAQPIPPRPTALRTAVDIAMERTQGIAPEASVLEQYQARYGGFESPPTPPGMLYPPGRVPRTRTVEGGFVALPEFKNTEDAIRFGTENASRAAIIKALRRRAAIFEAQGDRAQAAKNFNGASRFYTKMQLDHEAVQGAATRGERGFVALPEEGKVPIKKGVQEVSRAGAIVGIGEAASPARQGEQTGRVQRILAALNDALPIRGRQEALYTEARAQRIARVMAERAGGTGGEAGFHRELAQLKGPLPKAQYEAIRGKFSQQDIDELFNDINHSRLNLWEPIPAKRGLQKMLEGTVPTEGELSLLKKVFGPDLVKTLALKRPALNRFARMGLDVLGSMRAFAAGVGDMSLALRQGIVVAPRFPGIYARALGEMHRQYFDKRFFAASQREIAERPTFALMQEHGLTLTGMTEGMREEPFQGTLPQRIPGVRLLANAAERAYTGMGNRLRADIFDRYVDLNHRLGAEVYDLDQMSNVINTWTGRGALRIPITPGIESAPSLARMAPVLNAIFFSPRLLASRINLLDPMYYVSLSGPARREAIKTFAAFVAAGGSLLGLASAAGVKVGTDLRSADFGKLKFGNTRVDVWAGFQQPAVLLLRLASGQMVSSTTGREFTLGEGGYKPTTRLDIVSRFLGSKVSPPVRLALALSQGTTATGQKTNLSAEVANSFIPMFLGDLYELIDEHGLEGAWGGPLSFYGMNVQTYGRQIPNLDTTPSGRPTMKFRQPPELGEAALNALTGRRISNVPPQFHRALSQSRLAEQQHSADVDKAKALTRQDGKRRVVAGVLIIQSPDGIVHARTLRKSQTPMRLLQSSQRRNGVRLSDQ